MTQKKKKNNTGSLISGLGRFQRLKLTLPSFWLSERKPLWKNLNH